MKHSKLVAVGLLSMALMTSVLHFSNRSQIDISKNSSNTQQKNADFTASTAQVEVDPFQTKEDPQSTVAGSGSSAKASNDNQDKEVVSSFNSMIRLYSNYNPERLDDALSETELELEKGDYISRANSDQLSQEERAKLVQLLQTANAIRINKARIFLANDHETSKESKRGA